MAILWPPAGIFLRNTDSNGQNILILVIQMLSPDTGSLKLSAEAPHSKTEYQNSK